MTVLDALSKFIPEVTAPIQKHLGFNRKMKWTLTTLVSFFVLGSIPLWGLDPSSQFRFEQLELILGASFGSLISLGIGPIVTASIVLQLLNGSGIIKFDLHTEDGKHRFQQLQQVMSIFFVAFEAFIYVFMGGLTPPAGAPNFLFLQLMLILQLVLGGVMIMLLDQIVSKWGFGSGISLFIAAGVSKQLFVGIFSWLKSDGNYIGALWQIGDAIVHPAAGGAGAGILLPLGTIISTVVVFLAVVYTQSMKVEIPLSFGRIRGHGVRWPLNFFYTSNIPVILIAALLANLQLWARLLENWALSSTSGILHALSSFFGTYGGGTSPISGLAYYVTPPNLLREFITSSGSIGGDTILRAFIYVVVLAAGSVMFSFFWVQTAGLDSRSQAKNIMASGLQVPGFRKDPRVLERLLDRYVMPLTVMGGLAVGILAALADLLGALTSGTGLLLAVMIIYRTYEDLAREQVYDMNPMMRKLLGKE